MAIPDAFREFDEWLSDSTAEAEEIVPGLLELPAELLLRELRTRPGIRTAGLIGLLVTAVRESVDRAPARAHGIALAAARFARSAPVPPQFAFASRVMQGEAWREYARALHATARLGMAARAIRQARRFFADARGRHWHLSTVDLVEAPLLHDRGLRREALQMVREAAVRFQPGDPDHFADARLQECWMLCDAGDRAGAARVFTSLDAIARSRGDAALAARVAAKVGAFELHKGAARDAYPLLAEAQKIFDQREMPEAAARTRWNLARAAGEAGRIPTAISEYHKVHAQLLAAGAVPEAAIAAAEILELLLQNGHEERVASLTATFVRIFRAAGAKPNVLKALLYLRRRASEGCLTREDVAAAHAFFEELHRTPRARFQAP
jgi:tetratricopeptide (TPR) repeat protein